MAISIEQVEYVAMLAKLRFSEAEKVKLAEELNQILDYMEKLNELDTSDVAPLKHPTEVNNVMRDDEARPSLSADDAVRNAPSHQNSFFRVPKVIK